MVYFSTQWALKGHHLVRIYNWTCNPDFFSYKDVTSRTMLRNDFRLVQECYHAPAPLLGNTIPHSRKSPWHLTHPLQFFLHSATRGGHLCQLSLEKWQAEMQPSATVTWFTSTSGISAFQTKSFLGLKLTAPRWWQLHPQWPGSKSSVWEWDAKSRVPGLWAMAMSSSHVAMHVWGQAVCKLWVVCVM